MTLDPIAVVGRACILPSTDSPSTLWEHLRAGRDLISAAPPQRWRIDMDRAIDATGIDSSWSDRGGYVTDPFVFQAPTFAGLDPLFHWTALCAREAMFDANLSPSRRVQLIMANLSFPTEGFAQWGESKWYQLLGKEVEAGDARNAKMSGLPALLTAKTLGIGRAFSLDAACASALYALKLAAIRLQLREADAVLVGAVNRADPLFIHHGFTALKALSKSGQSRPFHPGADGLVPAEGCAFVAVKRLADVTDADNVLGVIRAIGLSNDGRAKGFLAPSMAGQVRAIRSAYGPTLSPDAVDFVECHATGTQLGDRVELESLNAVFGSSTAIGSHKGNFGHAITVAGMIGVLKAIGMLEHREMVPTVHLKADAVAGFPAPIKAQKFSGDTIAINAFGFGGNNAHLVLSRDAPREFSSLPHPQLFASDAVQKTGPFEEVSVKLEGLKFPPNDLKSALMQQVVTLELVRSIFGTCDPERTGFIVGMSCDIDVTRYGARWRAPELGDAIVPILDSSGVIGAMPNIVANRLNAQFDVTGPSFTVSSEEHSFEDAIDVARDLIACGDLDTVIVAHYDEERCRVVKVSTSGDLLLPIENFPEISDKSTGPIVKIERWPIEIPKVESKPAWQLPPMLPTPPAWKPVALRTVPRTPVKSTRFSVGDAHAQFVAQQAEVYQTFLSNYVMVQSQFLRNRNVSNGSVSATTERTEPINRSVEVPSTTALSRQQLEHLSRNNLSEIWGDDFADLDQYDVVVRMPEPPLLLADRVLRIDAIPRSMEPGSITTETDVTQDAWYLNQNRMPPGIMIESGQADLLLASYLGVDFENRGERAYRLLGCKLTYHDTLPKVGETLRYQIEIDGFAQHGDVRLFFFHYDCHSTDGRPRLSVREGQAGFFTELELADSGGVLWSEEEADFDRTLPFEAAPNPTLVSSLLRSDLETFCDGDLRACFGESFAKTATHTRTPSIWGDEKLFIDRVVELDFEGGPIGRGYLRAQTDVDPEAWFFDGHFHNDPCMPGTLMFEGCLQTMALFLSSAGHTIEKDGWRFEPVPGHEFHMRCRGQCTPESKNLVYELFVESMSVDAQGCPTLLADLLVTVDGLKAFHCRRMAYRLVPDWPLGELEWNGAHDPFCYPALLATAIGKPSDAFGPMYSDFDGAKKAPRLPGPPYHFMSRVAEATGQNAMEVGSFAVVDYDVPNDAWFFDHTSEMPFAVLLETGLQPCGWLASFVGCAAATDPEVFFRNLDGEGELHDVVRPTDRVVRTKTTLTKLVRSGDVTLVGFDVSMTIDGRPLYDLSTMFGFFPAHALQEQKGLDGPPIPTVSGVETDSTLETDMLRMVDSIEVRDQTVVGRKTFDPSDWFFKAHFFQDPVQPGSLGLEALLQSLRAYGVANGCVGTPRPTLHREHGWSYRGQVRPQNREGMFDVHVKENDGSTLVADGWLFVDGLRIYEFRNFGVTFT